MRRKTQRGRKEKKNIEARRGYNSDTTQAETDEQARDESLFQGRGDEGARGGPNKKKPDCAANSEKTWKWT